jgi:hypothetical protein
MFVTTTCLKSFWRGRSTYRGRPEGTWSFFYMYFMSLPVTVSCNCFLLYVHFVYTSDLVQLQSASAASCYQGEGMDLLE